MVEASLHGSVIARSDDTVVVDGSHYFPVSAIDMQHLRASTHTTECGWKGTASYFDVVVDETTCENAAWSYADPKPAAAEIAQRIAFWKDVKVTDAAGTVSPSPSVDQEACRVNDR